MADLFRFMAKYPLDAISHLFILLPIVIGIICYPSLQKESKLFWFYFLSVFVKESIGLYTALHRTPNLYLQNIQSILDITFLGLAFYYALSDEKLRKTLLFVLTVCLLVSLIFFKVDAISPINQTAGKLFCICAVLLFFNDILKGLRIVSLTHYPMFWLSSGLLVYGAGTFLIALFGQLLASNATSEDTFEFFWNTQQIIYSIFCVFGAIGFGMSRVQRKQTVISK